METKRTFIRAFVFLLGCFLVVPVVAQAADVVVDCSNPKAKIRTIAAALSQIRPAGPNTIRISGTCNESVTIEGFDRLALIGSSGASITTTVDSWAALAFVNSDHVTVEGLTIDATGAMGGAGLLCTDLSVCVLRDLTVEGGNAGIRFVRASGMVLRNTLIEHSSVGLALSDAKVILSSDTTAYPVIRQNEYQGIAINDGSTLAVIGVTIENNGADGINAMANSTLRMSRTTIQNNSGNGISLQEASVGRIANSTVISNNAGFGVRLGDLSFASFDATVSITTQGGLKVACRPQLSATRGVGSVAGSNETDCLEPAP
jgi:parallel beta helix pectate lyase-like protein